MVIIDVFYIPELKNKLLSNGQTVGSPGSGNGPNVQDHKRLEHHTLTQNLKAMGLWVPSVIYPLFSPFLVDVGHNHSHLIT